MDTDPTVNRGGPEVDAFRGSEPAGGGPRRVLLVDDEPGAADLAATHVERLLDGVETVTRTSPTEALDVVREERVDCVVSDYNMPGTHGLELLEQARAIDPGLPFVLFTGRGSEEIASEAISAGVTDYLQKGVSRDRYEMLANSVENALSRRRAERDLREVNAKVTAIHEFATDVSAAENAAEVFERVVDAAEGILDFNRCVTLHRRGDQLVPAARSASVGEDEVRTFAVGEGVVGATAADERTIVVDSLSVDPADPDALEDPESPGRSGGRAESDSATGDPDARAGAEELAEPVADDIRSAISVPIGAYGVFQAVSDGYAAFDGGDVEFAELLAAHAADALEQLETEHALRAERDRLSALFEDLPLPVARTAGGDGSERRLDATNRAFEETFGFSEAGNDYETIREEVVPDDEPNIDPAAVIAADEPLRREVRRKTADGLRDFILNVIPVERPDETIIYNVYADIGEQKRIERTLRRLHETTREMFRGGDREEIAALAARAAVDILGFPSSGVRLYDPDAEALLPTALSEEATEALGERPAFGPGDGRLWDAFETGESIVVDDLNAVDTAIGYGEHRSLLVVPLGDHGVMPLGSREPGFFDDTAIQLARVLGANVTVALDDARRTAQLRDRDAELQREIDRLEKFAGLVSHDLRNPLNVAAGRLDIARTKIDDDDALDELARIAAAHDRMEELIDDLLALARQGRTVDELESVSLADAAARAWRSVDTADATLELPERTLAVEADPERLRTLLENLFTNSVEHGVTESAADAGSVAVSVGALADGFYVADDGGGFEIDPEEAIEYGTSNDPRGTGFGLAIVREIAAAHGWSMDVIDEDGARFEFRTDR
ncbi:histidine kinase [Halorubrum persicum]|uniref:histidine kinase n=1 Tax=Halorubrum persicum TaxID=1383844 RepID=A0A2G1WN61_9EURY|nr:GAF domain-containing protein [Halorubrum persicum]PHQ40309.1 histidine kinase [Halorubrum persicum]